jgi:hypothetical protein
LYKGLHGVFLFFRGWWYNHSERRKRRFHHLFGCGEAALGFQINVFRLISF